MAGTQTMQPKSKLSSQKLSALELAAMGKRRALGGQEPTNMEVDPEDRDWAPLVRKAKQNGPGSWFASKVDFTFNSARFVGKVGYPVQGEVIPLFDGAAMDVSDAEMKAEKPEKAEPDPHMGAPSAYKNWVIGSGGLLILAPVDADNVIPVRTEKFIVTESSISATASKDMAFRKGDATIQADRMDLSNQSVILYGVRVKIGETDKSEEYQEIAAINQEGIALLPAPKPIQEMPGRRPDALERAGKLGTELAGRFALESGSEAGIDLSGGNFTLEKEGELASNEEEGEDPLWTAVLDALKEEAQGNLEKAMTNLLKGDAGKAAQIFTEKWDQIKAIYDGFSDEGLRESWKLMPDTLKDIFTGKITEEDEIKNYMKKLFPTDELMDFLGMGENDDQELDEKKSKSGAQIPLVSIDLFPGLAEFAVYLQPAYTFCAYAKARGKNLHALWNTRDGEEAELNFTAGVRGSLSIKAVAELSVGIPFIIKGYASLYAQGGLKGALEGETENAMLEANMVFPVKRTADGSFIQAAPILGSLKGGLMLEGSVGTKGGIRSSLLMWEKTLFEKEFGSWKLGAIYAQLNVSKEPGGGLFSGWSLDEASLAIDGPNTGFGGAFQKENTAAKKYGLYDPEIKESGKYAQIHEDFMKALEMLKKFAGGQANEETLVIGTQEGEGVDQILSAIEEIRTQFVVLWADGVQEQQIVLMNLDELEQSGKYRKEENRAKKGIQKHENRLIELGKMDDSPGGDIFQAYSSVTDAGGKGHAGGGYQKAMEDKARESATGFDQIVNYERKRYQEKIKPHEDRINLVIQCQQKNLSDEEILALYEKKAGNEIEGHRAMFQDTQAIIRYEENMIREKKGKKDSPDARYQKIENMKAENQDPKDFFPVYLKELSNLDAIYYGTPELLLEYEKRMMEGAKALLDEADQIQENIRKVKDGSMASQEAMDQFRQGKKKPKAAKLPEILEILGSDLYRTASVDDLLEVELGSAYTALRDYLAGEEEGSRGGGNATATKEKQKEIFGEKGAGQAAGQFEAYLNGLNLTELIPNMTADMLMDYAREEGVGGRERDYINAIWAKVSQLSKKPEEARKAELEGIRQYFTVFSSSKMARYSRDTILSRETVDLSMMMEALERGAGKTEKEQGRIGMLREAKESGRPSYRILQEYLDEGGSKDGVAKHQKEKALNGRLSLEDILRFYQSKLIEKTDVGWVRKVASEKSRGLIQKKAGHYERYDRLKAMQEDNASYEEMLEAYKEMGGGNAYGEDLKKKILAGELPGITVDQVMSAEGAKRDRENTEVNRRNARIDLVRQMEGEGNGYQEILKAYEKRARTDGSGVKGEVKAMVSESELITLKTGFEKSLSGPIKAADILLFEQAAMERDGAEHAVRLRGLLGLPVDSTEFLTAPLPVDDAVRTQRREDYLREFKGFKTSNEVENKTAAGLGQLLSLPAPEQMESILSYERERSQYYWRQLTELLQRKKRLEDMKAHLDSMEKICHSVTFNIQNVRNNPQNLWNMVGQFEQDVETIRLKKEKEEQNQKERAEIGTELERLKKEEAR